MNFKMLATVLLLGVLCSLTNTVQTARILGVFPVPSISHQVVFRALTTELAKRGHELVVVTPNPAYVNEKPAFNITEIDTSSIYKIFEHLRAYGPVAAKRGVIMDTDLFNHEGVKMMLSFADMTFDMKEVKDLLNDKSQKFDLIISEALFHLPLMLSKVYDAPHIWVSSLYPQSNNLHTVGAPTSHPFLHPSGFRNRFFNLTFWEKLKELYVEAVFWDAYRQGWNYENTAIKKHFGDDALSVHELRSVVDLVFTNVNPIFEGNRPVPPNLIYLGALHLQPVKELPNEWKSYLDSSTRGVVYVSLGTNVFPSDMDPDLLEAFIDAFEALPYDVLWKFDGDHLARKPKNLRIEKWFPQRDLLFHPNIKVFVTQGGMQSTDEAIDAAVPLVGIPMLADQWYNVEHYIRLGIGEMVEPLTLDAEKLVKTVHSVIENKQYKLNIIKLRNQLKDQPETPLERAIWWTEYVLRHKGAKHLRSMAANMTWSQYLELDFVLKLFALVTVIVTAIVLSLRYVISLVFVSRTSKKLKKR